MAGSAAPLGRILPDWRRPCLPGLCPVAGEAVEHDPVRLDADDRAVVDHQRAGILDVHESVLGMHPKQLRRRAGR